MKRKDFDSLIDSASFAELFISELGWDNPSNNIPIQVDFDACQFDFVPVAEKSGFQVYKCMVEDIPTASECKMIDNKLRRFGYDYICVFVQNETRHHLWLTPVKSNEKRELVKTEYEGGAKADFLFSKIDGFTFNINERVLISDVKSKVQGSFQLNSEEVTKAFYKQFNEQHKSFRKHIKGISDEKNIDWYASVMLNRLMFCYFVQKKGFLNFDTNYLRNKLVWVKKQQGENKFYGSFYKGFLCALFHDGLNNPKHDTSEFIQIYGRIPYLNGGMFDDHQLERENKDIDIADKAFENLFDFFDKWNWHLDTRLTASGKDINPDVLGYIFEQYINDRAAMGAYYTKEDITEYIGKNCIIPFLINKIEEKSKDAFKSDGFVWRYLKSSGDKYIYDAVKKGYSSEWKNCIPDYISKGIDTTTANLLGRRERWNEKTFDEFALPTEIWRETIERLQRCESLLNKISKGEINNINDFITYNLDIRQFAEDLIRESDDHQFVLHFYEALQSVTILDPTCGSGAFLFAALNILEPLYEACLDKMEEWNLSDKNLFVNQLAEVAEKYGNNRQYFIYKSIILRNLYGVDIMVEATEIAKLRLFLKMVAVVEVDKRKDNLGLEPLPDVDFNIKCGNTLVGYATENELNKALLPQNGGWFATKEFKTQIQTEMQEVAKSYNHFRSEQLKLYEENDRIKETKEMLKQRLSNLNELLNKFMYNVITNSESDYNDWLKSHQPFHWLAEFYQIIKEQGGFDVIIGNPPYIEHKSNYFDYSLSHLKSADCGNLYGNCIERGLAIGSSRGKFSFIIPVAITCSKRMDKVISMLRSNTSLLYFANFDDRPGKLFEMIQHLRATIFIASRDALDNKSIIFATKYNRWYTNNRYLLFDSLRYTQVSQLVNSYTIPKFSFPIECSIYKKLLNSKYTLAYKYATNGNNRVYYRAAGGGYFLLIKCQESSTVINGNTEFVKAEKSIIIENNTSKLAIGALLSSSLFYWNYIAYTDCRNLSKAFIDSFRYVDSIGKDPNLINLGNKLFVNYEATKLTKNTTSKKTGKNVIYDEYYPKLSKHIIDKIDKVIAGYYRFTEEELDFIINFDIKYRMSNKEEQNQDQNEENN